MKTGIELIAAERQKQIDKHGFTGEHHAQHPEWYDRYQLLQAAISLLLPEVMPHDLMNQVPDNWDAAWFKNLTERSQEERMEISGALIAAEIDRRQFLNGKKPEYRHFIPVTLTKEEFGKVLGQVLDEIGMFYKFKEHIEGQGYSLNEFGLTE